MQISTIGGFSITGYATWQTQLAHQYIVQLGQTAANLTPPLIVPEFPTVGDAPAISINPPPTMDAIIWTAPELPSAFSGDLTVEGLLPEPFDETPPALVYGAAPLPPAEDNLTPPPVNLVYDDPVLDLTLPSAPSLLSLSTIAFDGVTIPTFDEDVPELTVVAPSILTYTPGDAYTSSLLTYTKSSLEDRIRNGGTGLNPDAEEAIWNRGRERELRANTDALREIDRMAETMGYALPSGVWLDARLKVQTENAYVAAGLSREIMIKQAELELQNVQQSLAQAIQLEGILIQNNNAVEQRLFESSKYATEAGVAIYNARVQAYAAYVDAYKTKVSVYEARVRGELAKVEVYKARIDAEQTKAQMNSALVQQYKVQVDAALANVEVYKAQISAIQTKAAIEKTKVEIFGEQVKAYTAKVNAYTAGVEGFRATIQAETAKQGAYKSQVEAYTARVQAASKVADVRIEEFKARLAAKNIEWDAFKAQASAESARVQAISSVNSARADVYRAEVAGLSGYHELLTKQWQVSIDQAQRVSEIGVASAKANAELFMTVRSLAMDAAKVGAQVSAQLGAAALNAVNYSSSNSFSISDSVSKVYSYSESLSA